MSLPPSSMNDEMKEIRPTCDQLDSDVYVVPGQNKKDTVFPTRRLIGRPFTPLDDLYLLFFYFT